MTDALLAYRALAGLDPNCQDYIAAMAGEGPAPAAPAVPAGDLDLAQAVEKGLRESAVAAARAALERQAAPGDHRHRLDPRPGPGGGRLRGGAALPAPAPDERRGRQGRLRAPEGAHERQGSGLPAGKAKVVLATVKGDVHDIGKNIVKVLLENYGYRVIDLGKDVSPEAVAEAVVRERAELCGLSALMTTTVGSMEATIRLLREQAPWCRIMAGGAVLTEDYARRIGADFYGRDAMSDVRYADSVAAGD